MEELKLLVQMVANLPTLAIWVVVAFYAYKVVIVGSIYGVIRFVAQKIHDVMLAKKTIAPIIQEINLADKLRGIYITQDETFNLLALQLQRLRGKNVGGGSFIHERSVDWLREAINDKEDKEKLLDKKA